MIKFQTVPIHKLRNLRLIKYGKGHALMYRDANFDDTYYINVKGLKVTQREGVTIIVDLTDPDVQVRIDEVNSIK